MQLGASGLSRIIRKWFDYLAQKFDVMLGADDSIVTLLYKKGMPIKVSIITSGNDLLIKTKSEQIFRFLSENSEEIDAIICECDGYIGL